MEYETPLDAHEVDDGYAFILMYGSESDWVKNVRVADAARLRLGDETVSLHSPRIVDPSHLPSGVKLPPSFLKVDEVLRMDRV